MGRVAIVIVFVAVVLGSLLAAPGVARAKVRIAIPEFQIEGGASPALSLQLQDGFVQGFVRAGLQVLDPVDTSRRLEAKPELARCDSSLCLKAIGQLMDVKYVARVKVEVAGNSYKMVGRIFSTEGPTPAALPVATKSKSCDVCTVAEAREIILRLADALRVYIEDATPPLPAPPPPPPPPPPALTGPIIGAMAGALTAAAGFAVLASIGKCTATGCSENRFRSAAGGVMIGVGLTVAATGTYVVVTRLRERSGTPPTTGIAVAIRW
jgi:hypothetical protein